jgi:hypothetical protein
MFGVEMLAMLASQERLCVTIFIRNGIVKHVDIHRVGRDSNLQGSSLTQKKRANELTR